MKTHDEIKKLLPAYCGNDLEQEEKELVEEHLRSCAECRAELSDLELAMRLIRTTPQVEPPPWMTARIMSKILDHAPEKRSWLQRIFFPLYVKVPLQVMALMVICVSSYYLSKRVETELSQQPTGEEIQTVPVPVPAPAIPSRKELNETKQESRSDPGKVSPSRPEASTGKVSRSIPELPEARSPSPIQRSLTPSSEEPATGGSIHPPAPASKQEIPSSEYFETKRAAPRGSSHDLALSADSAMKMKRAKGLESLERESAQAARPTRLSIHCEPDDPSSAAETIPLAIIQSGGSLVRDGYSPPPRRLRARIPSGRLPELAERLRRLGRITALPSSAGTEGMVEVDIIW